MALANVVWDALRTQHRRFAICAGQACRYPAAVAPFAAVEPATSEAMRDLATLLLPDESVWLVGDNYPKVEGLAPVETLECLQMILPTDVTAPDPEAGVEIVPLSAAHAGEMVALTDVAFPGFFRKRTCEMGSYLGVRLNGELIAMGGERLMLDGYAEISGLCAHPSHRGKGLATRLIWELVRMHRRNGIQSFLHVGCPNKNAIRLYFALGFKESRKLVLTRHVAT